jgi:hypothetical protein
MPEHVPPLTPLSSKTSAAVVSMRLPDEMQGWGSDSSPHAHHPLHAACRPQRPILADGYIPDSTDSLGQDSITDQRPGKRGPLHLDTLQICRSYVEVRELQSVQVPTLEPQ